MKYALLLVIVCLAGCGMPETARATKQVEQAVDGSIEILSTVEDEKMREISKKVITLLQSAKISLQPALAYLGEGKEIKIDTTVQEAVKSPETFVIKANMQAGRAAVEVEDRLKWESLISFDNVDNWIMDLSLWLTGSGAAGMLIVGILKKIRTYKSAISDAVAYGKEAVALDPKDTKAKEALKEKHAKRQKQRGTKTLIDTSLQKVKDGTHA